MLFLLQSHIHAYEWSDSGVYVYVIQFNVYKFKFIAFKKLYGMVTNLETCIPTTGGPKGSSCPHSFHLSHAPCQILFSPCCFSMWQFASRGTHTDVFISLSTSLPGPRTKPRPRPSSSQKGAHLHQGPRSPAWTRTRWKI